MCSNIIGAAVILLCCGISCFHLLFVSPVLDNLTMTTVLGSSVNEDSSVDMYAELKAMERQLEFLNIQV